MKWGKRRYQYKDGSLTPEGKKRYLKEAGTSSEKLLNASIGPRLKEAMTSSKNTSDTPSNLRLKEAASSEKLINASVGPRLKEAMASSEKLLSMKIESVQDKYKTLGEKFVSSHIGVKAG